MRKILILLLAVLFLSSCGRKEPAPVIQDPPSQPVDAPLTEEPPPEEEKPVIMYPGAIPDYLGYIYDYSWYQEFPPEFVMIHFCSAVVDHPDDPYNIKHVRQTFIDADVSIHYIIDREGTVYCCIPENRTAWHAGVGEWLGEEKYKNNLNRYSIGIELMAISSYEDMSIYMTEEDYNALDPSLIGYTDAQYAALQDLVADICRRQNIPMDRDHVIGHEEFSTHKNDPGELFDWSRIIP